MPEKVEDCVMSFGIEQYKYRIFYLLEGFNWSL